MVYLIAFLEATQNGNRIFLVGLIDQDALKAPLKGRILLHILSIFIECSSTHTMQLPTRKRRFEHIAGIHRPLGLTCTHHGVELVDEENDLAVLFT